MFCVAACPAGKDQDKSPSRTGGFSVRAACRFSQRKWSPHVNSLAQVNRSKDRDSAAAQTLRANTGRAFSRRSDARVHREGIQTCERDNHVRSPAATMAFVLRVL